MTMSYPLPDVQEPVCWKGQHVDLDAARISLTDKEKRSLVGAGDESPLHDLGRRIKFHLDHKLGFCILDGLEDACESDEAYQSASLRLGNVLGTPVTQNTAGDRLVLVKDEGASTRNPTHRGHKTRDALGFHNDRCDIILLTCVHQSDQGGESTVVSAKYAHDVIRDSAPHHLEVLYRDFPNHRRGEQRPGEAAWCLLPVFASVNGRFVCRFVKRFITDSQLLPDAPRLTEEQMAALDYMDALIGTEGVHLRFKLRDGEICVMNNHTVLHGRSNYVDAGLHQRTMIRIWLAHPESRPLPPSFRSLYVNVEAGAVRGGI